MGPTLRIASEKDGHTLTDRATYLAFRTRTKLPMPILLEGDAPLLKCIGRRRGARRGLFGQRRLGVTQLRPLAVGTVAHRHELGVEGFRFRTVS